MLELTAVEFFKLRRRLMAQVLTAVMVVGMLFQQVLLFLVATVLAGTSSGSMKPQEIETLKNELAFPHSLTGSFAFGLQMVSIFSIVLVGGLIGSEYSWGTVRTMAINARGRMQLLGAKVVALVGAGLGWILLGVVVTVIISLVLTPLMGRSIQGGDISSGDVGRFVLLFLRTELAVLPYAALAFLFAVIGRSPVAGIGGGIGFYFIESTAVSLLGAFVGATRNVIQLTIGWNAQSVMRIGAGSSGLGMNTDMNMKSPFVSPEQAALVLAAYTALFLGIAFYVFKRRDITVGH